MIGLCVFLSNVFLVATLAYCVCRYIKTKAGRNLDSDIYMDTGFTPDTSVSSTYQDLNAPPNLPERRLTRLGKNKLLEDEGELSVPKNPQCESTHDDIETIFTSKTALLAKDGSTDAMSLSVENKDTNTLPHDIASSSRAISHDETCEPAGNVPTIGQDNSHEYMDMNTVYKKLTKEIDVDVDGYLLPSKTSEKAEPPSSVEKTCAATLTRDITRISTATSFHCENEEPLGNAPNAERIDTHGYTNMTSVDEKLLNEKDVA